MAEACIVCLGDLALEDSNAAIASHEALTAGQIAHLLPCGHNLHNDCLKPWVERCNSCPICRATFSQVHLKAAIGGIIISTYEVQDKKQEPEFDPSMIIDDDVPCTVCEARVSEEEMIVCDSCGSACHIPCAGLDAIPEGAWFCYSCDQDPPRTAETTPQRPPRWRTLARRRRNSMAWTRVWQSVWNRLNLDLDFPFDDEQDAPVDRASGAQRAEIRQWQDRFRTAERQNAARRTQETASALPDPFASPRQSVDPSSQEELRAWNAFERERDLQQGASSTTNRRKRKTTASPSETPGPEGERKPKRPRSRRTQVVAAAAVESDALRRPNAVTAAAIASSTMSRADANNAGSPSFIQSLLKEVEAYPIPPKDVSRPGTTLVGSAAEDARSPYHSSRGASPAGSSNGTPDARSPPQSPSRSISPPPLSTTISPIYPRAPELTLYSPIEPEAAKRRRLHHTESDTDTNGKSGSSSRQHSPHSRLGRCPHPKSTSSTRAACTLSSSAKSEIQMMVSAALKPWYHKAVVNTGEFTDINRAVSRKLYEKVGDDSRLVNAREKKKWAEVAVEEVENAVKALKAV